jgi:glycosyltransferase involved in cell wall biosynthesis
MVALPLDLLRPRAVSDIFLNIPSDPDDDLAPLTPFMIHVWRQNGLSDGALHDNNEREHFIYWFYDSYHLSRTPYSLAAPPKTLRWLNSVVLDLSGRVPRDGNPSAQPYYLTRYMLHVWELTRREADVFQCEGYLRFLSWFALAYIPSRNLPPALLPDNLLPLLNRPVRPPLPLTAAMAAWAKLRDMAGADEIPAAPEESVVALACELLSDLLHAGDPRLVPDLVSQFWSRRMSPEPDALTAYEYFLLRVCRQNPEPGTARDWLAKRCRAAIPEADLFAAAPSSSPVPSTALLNSPDRVVVVYRDHHTVAGLSKAGLQTKEALRRSGLEVIDLDFCFGRERMAEEAAHNFSRRRSARTTLHILNINPEYVPDCLMCHLSSLDESAYRIGQFYWELSDTAPIHDCGLSLIHEIWVATQYLREVYRKRVSAPVHVMGQAIESPEPDGRFDRSTFNLPKNVYTFLFSFDAGSVVERKNPLASVQAFRKAFPAGTEKAALVLKTRNLGGIPTDRDRHHWRQVAETAAADSRIHILDNTLTAAELTGLLSTCDCYVSLHRSEGFGYGPADAMALGKPVIATAYSGVTDFCTSATALLVDYKLERVPAGAYPYIDDSREYYWAAPDIDIAAFQMRRLYQDPRLGERLGDSGRRLIREHYSLAALQLRYLRRLTELGWL